MNTFSRDGIVIGFTSVVGDMLHAGHSLMLDECKRHCDYLYVGLMVDPTRDRPNKNKPIQSMFERHQQLASHRAVDEVIPCDDEKDLLLAIVSLPINVRFVGEEYYGVNFTGKKECEELGINIMYNRRRHNLSSTELRVRAQGCFIGSPKKSCEIEIGEDLKKNIGVKNDSKK